MKNTQPNPKVTPQSTHTYLDIHADRNKIKLILAGGTSGLISKTAVAPISRITVLFQVQKLAIAQIPEVYTQSILSAMKNTYQNEGLLAFWKGNGTHAIKKAPFSAIKFFFYERYKQFLTPKDQQLPSPFIRFVSGGLAAATAVFTTYPLDVVQTQLTVQTKQNKYKGITGTLRTIYHEEGFAQLYRGLLMGFLSVVPYIALNMSIWESLKQFFVKKNGGEPSLIISAFCGAISGSVASTSNKNIQFFDHVALINHSFLKLYIQLNCSKGTCN